MATTSKHALLPRWRPFSSAGSAPPSFDGSALSSDTLAKNVTLGEASPVLVRDALTPSPFAFDHSWSRVVTVVALVSVLALVGIALGPMQSINAGSSSSTQFQSTTSLKLRAFNVSTRTLQHRDSLDVHFAYDNASTAALVALTTTDVRRDWIGAYCIDKDHEQRGAVAVHDWIDRRFTNGTAAGTVTFGPLINMRCAWQFRFVAFDSHHVLATSAYVRFIDGDAAPSQLHLALTAVASAMRVHWVSAAVEAPIVQYGVASDALILTSNATARSYNASDLCEAPATTVAAQWFRDPGTLYDAVMTNLNPETTYYYRVGSVVDHETATRMSAVQHFTTAPRPGAAATTNKTTSFVVFGDLNASANATREFAVNGSCGTTIDRIQRDVEGRKSSSHAYAAVVHVGDVSYAEGRTFVWDHFGALIAKVAASIPYMVSVGNHDYGFLEGGSSSRLPANTLLAMNGAAGHQSNGECGVPLARRFQMPATGNSVYWYSFTTGLIAHVVLSGEHDVTRGSQQYKWLVHTLRRVDRTKTPWLVVYIHRPLYCSVAFAGDFDRSLLLRDALEQLLSDFHVDVVFSGHYHSYERTCAVFDDVCYEEKGSNKALAPVHIMIGAGGADIDVYGYYDAEWRREAIETLGYGRVHVFNATHLRFEFVANNRDEDDAVADATWIVSDHTWPNDRIRRRRWRKWAIVALACVVVVVAAVGTAIARVWRRWRQRPAAAANSGYSKTLALQGVL